MSHLQKMADHSFHSIKCYTLAYFKNRACRDIFQQIQSHIYYLIHTKDTLQP